MICTLHWEKRRCVLPNMRRNSCPDIAFCVMTAPEGCLTPAHILQRRSVKDCDRLTIDGKTNVCSAFAFRVAIFCTCFLLLRVEKKRSRHKRNIPETLDLLSVGVDTYDTHTHLINFTPQERLILTGVLSVSFPILFRGSVCTFCSCCFQPGWCGVQDFAICPAIRTCIDTLLYAHGTWPGNRYAFFVFARVSCTRYKP